MLKLEKILFLVLIALSIMLSCKNKSKSNEPYNPPTKDPYTTGGSSAGVTPRQSLGKALAECAGPQFELNGIAVVYDLTQAEKGRPICLAVAESRDTFVTTQGCRLPAEAKDLSIATFNKGTWSHYEVRALRQAPFAITYGWMTKVGSLDLTVLTVNDSSFDAVSRIGNVPWSQRRHHIQFTYLQETGTLCPVLEQEEIKGFPYVYEWGSPLPLGTEVLSPEIFLGEGSMSCAATKAGTVLSMIFDLEGTTNTQHVGVYSRSTRFIEPTCGDRGEEIFLNLQTAKLWNRATL